MRKIVVGVDGSANADEALVWAMREARDRRCEVEAIMAWHEPTDVAAMGAIGIDLSLLEQDNREVLDEILEAARRRMPDVPLKGVLVRGTASQALIDAGREAEMVVVGRRGHNAAMRLLLGSVSGRVARHATCPVVVVPLVEHDDG